MKELIDSIILYININKQEYNIDYVETIQAIREVLTELEEEYKGVE